MKFKIGEKIRIKSKDWHNENSKERLIIYGHTRFPPFDERFMCYGEFATIKNIGANEGEYYLDGIGNRDWIWKEDELEPINDDWTVNMPKNIELKKSVTVNIPNDMEVSTNESDGNVTINVQHKEEKVDFNMLEDGKIIFIHNTHGNDWISIFKELHNNEVYVHAAFNVKNNDLFVDLENLWWGWTDNISIRYATKEEKQKIFDELVERANLLWNENELKFEENRWRAENDEQFWYITSEGYISYSYDTRSPIANDLYKLHNYFQTEELAKEVLPKLKEFFSNINRK